MTIDPHIVLRDVRMSYRRGRQDVVIFDGLNFDIPSGSFTALMGPSGSGKTTLLNLIGGLDRPQAGTVEVASVVVNRLSESALARWRASHVGFVFQFYNLMPVLTAQENVELPLLLTKLGKAERRERAAAAIQLVGLTERAGHKPSELSGGQQQRVAIARAIVSDPAIILADEPTGDLDRESADEVLRLLQLLNQDLKKTIVMVTHDRTAAGCAGTILQLEKGEFRAAAERAT
jgi:putative ABC transport system ATP-binding protein